MDTYRAFLAIIISFVILIGYQYFFVGFDKPPVSTETVVKKTEKTEPVKSVASTAEITKPQPEQKAAAQPAVPTRSARKITVDTALYTAVLSENGGAIESFILKEHTETSKAHSPGKQLVMTTPDQGFPLKFSWGSAVAQDLLFDSDGQEVTFGENGKAVLTMKALTESGLEIERTFTFDTKKYLIDLAVKVTNTSAQPLQGIAQLHQINSPFEGAKSSVSMLFSGPAAFISGALQEVKSKEFAEGAKTLQGKMDWAGYEGNYFLCAILPLEDAGATFTMQGTEALTTMQVAGNLDTLKPGAAKKYSYHIFYGPKKLTLLKEIGFNLDKAINFGWFDVVAKPTLWLLNFFHDFFGNYGIAIILVTVLFKAVFWPITQKGMKSMKNMQKLQPKMVKIKEKYKNDPAKMNQEVMGLYKTYKVNPLGGCLPMVLQIPVFFALYKVLLQCIELRHAPFMLWITDLSAPDRLWIGLNLPYLGGIPVLTLLMGASMFFQQKLSPTTADPAQAKIMMFLPVIFTFMFLNFASGLVLYWFVNNLLAILQQYMINRGNKPAAA
ncbi:MAG: membrane protein insertase YidC [Desulfoprunum sp.]|nr:membrane protein insertase YidC [Desulfoprunum sp.]